MQLTFLLSLACSSPWFTMGIDVTSGRSGRLIRGEGPLAMLDASGKAIQHPKKEDKETAKDLTTTSEPEDNQPAQKDTGITTWAPSDTHPHLLNTQPPEEDATKAKGPFHPDEPVADPTYSDQKATPVEKKRAKKAAAVSRTQPAPPSYNPYVPSGNGGSGGLMMMLILLCIGVFLGAVIATTFLQGVALFGGEGESGSQDAPASAAEFAEGEAGEKQADPAQPADAGEGGAAENDTAPPAEGAALAEGAEGAANPES